MGLLETGTFTPSPEEPALLATGIGWTGERPNSFSNSRIENEVADEGDDNALAICLLTLLR